MLASLSAKPSEQYLDAGHTRVRVQFLAPSAVRVTHAAPGHGPFPPDRPWLSHVLRPGAPVAPEAAGLVAGTAEGRVTVRTRSGEVVLAEAWPPRLAARHRSPTLRFDVTATEVQAELNLTRDAVRLALKIEPGEGFYSWGEWFDAFRRESGQVKLRNRDAHALIQQRNTYSGIPIFVSSRGYLFWLLNSHESLWHIDAARGVLEITAAGPGADYLVIHGPAFRDILATYTALTGRPPLLPRWALGLMVTGYPQEPQAVVLQRVDEHRRRGIPLDALILDYHWEERYHNFRWRRSLFPDPEGLIAGLKAHGVRLGLIFTPFVNRRNRRKQRFLLDRLGGNRPAVALRDDERALPEYEAARTHGWLAHPNARWWFGKGGMIDFANPEAAAWWNSMLQPLYAQGVAFFKNDDGEYLPRDAHSALGIDGREYHNLYGFFYGRAIYDGMRALDGRRPFIYARSVWAGSQRYPAMFLGDQKPTYSHLRAVLRAALNLGLLGFAHWTADVFGLDGHTTPELHRRYAQLTLLAPVARYFWRPPATDDTRFPWSHGPANEANFRRYAELRYRLLPYYHNLGWEAYRTGLPVVRPMLLEYQAEKRFAEVADQVLLGDELLIAPILEPEAPASGVARRKVLLPAGRVWHDFWSQRSEAGGGSIEYEAPADCLPLLVRGGSILPMAPPLPFIPDDHRFDRLELHCWPPYPAELVFYDDDGRTRAYEAGAYSTTRVRATGNPALGAVRVEIAAAEGGFPEQAAARQVRVLLHRAPQPAFVRAIGHDLAAPLEWDYDHAQKVVSIALVCPVHRATTIEVGFAPG